MSHLVLLSALLVSVLAVSVTSGTKYNCLCTVPAGGTMTISKSGSDGFAATGTFFDNYIQGKIVSCWTIGEVGATAEFPRCNVQWNVYSYQQWTTMTIFNRSMGDSFGIVLGRTDYYGGADIPCDCTPTTAEV